MMRPKILTMTALALASSPALAQSVSQPSTTLSEVVVGARSPVGPTVVSTFPEAGATVQPGALIVKITFDQRMNPEGWDYGKGAERYPNCLARPRLLPDEKTFILLCTAGPSTKFSMAFNTSHTGGFQNLAGQVASPANLEFSTNSGASLSTIEDAMKSASLKADQGPVMDNKPSALAASSPSPAVPPKP